MNQNPLFPGSEDDNKPNQDDPASYLLPSNQPRQVTPPSNPPAPRDPNGLNPAVNLLREKLDRLYAQEPTAREELQEAEAAPARSPHQQFMYELSHSGKSLAEIQTDWHNYYVRLSDDQKRQVWQEFYEANNIAQRYRDTAIPATQPATASKAREVLTKPKADSAGIVVSEHAPAGDKGKPTAKKRRAAAKKQTTAIKKAVRTKVAKRAERLSVRQRQNLRSLFFGLACGIIALIIVMFSFFNELIIAPFIQPSRADATPIIVDNDSAIASGVPKVIIPKINVEIPVVYSASSDDESVIENALMQGVVHYPSTVLPGQTGNAAFFGHSSNNIFNKGQYKFAFVLLHTLVQGDTFYLTYNGTVYAYKVISRQIVDPSDIQVLNDIPGQTATATLITCDPPGTSLHRLVVVGQQISPDPAGNATGNNTSQSGTTANLASNGPTLWYRFWHWLF